MQINSTLPIAYELYRSRGNLDPRRLLGVTTLDVMRANTMVAEAKGLDVTKVNCPVIGGRSSATIIPVFSQCTPAVTFPPHERASLTRKIQVLYCTVLSSLLFSFLSSAFYIH